MKKNKTLQPGSTEIRRRAVEQLKKSGRARDFPASAEELQRILQEHSIHKIELEQKHYADLYDFAPVGYLTLTADSRILEANLTASRMLSLDRSRLNGAWFGSFIAQADLHAFQSMMQKVFQTGTYEHSEVMIVNVGTEESQLQRIFRLDAIISENLQECRITLIDVSDTRRAVEALKNDEERFRRMFEGHSAIMMIINPDTGFIMEANYAATKFYRWSIDQLRSMRIQEINIHTAEQITLFLEQSRSGEKTHFLFRQRRADNSIRDVEVYSSIIEISGETLLYLVVHNVTERLRHETASAFRFSLLEKTATHSIKQLLQITLDKVEQLTDSSIGFFHFVDEDQTTLSQQAWSTNTINNMCKAEGEGKHSVIDQAGIWADALRERNAVIHNDYASLQGRKGMPEGHAEVRREVVVPVFRNDNVVAIIGVGNKILNYGEDDIQWISMLADAAWDVIAKKIADEERIILQAQKISIEQLAMHDSLTGLPNRRLLSERISLALAQARRNKTLVALMIFDLDKFKPVNDTLGHAIGDTLLQQVAALSLATLKRSGDSIARIGGDEFVILLPQISAASNAMVIAEKILHTLNKPFDIEGNTINISCSIGIAIYPDHGLDELTLMRHADEAMYTSKKEGRSRITMFTVKNRKTKNNM